METDFGEILLSTFSFYFLDNFQDMEEKTRKKFWRIFQYFLSNFTSLQNFSDDVCLTA